MQKIVPNLWYDKEAEEAAKFYVSIFPNSKITKVTHYGKAGYDIHKMPEGTVLTVEFQLDGQDFLGLNGGPLFKFNEAVSFIVNCETQEEVDELWDKLSADPASEQCGWLKDKYGLSWQIVPTALNELLESKDTEKSNRAMEAMLQMKKLDITKLKQAYEGS